MVEATEIFLSSPSLTAPAAYRLDVQVPVWRQGVEGDHEGRMGWTVAEQGLFARVVTQGCACVRRITRMRADGQLETVTPMGAPIRQ